MPKILHIAPNGIFIYDFIHFLEKKLNCKNHTFYLYVKNESSISDSKCLIKNIPYHFSLSIFRCKNLLSLFYNINKADKIILHGLNETLTILMLFFMPWNLKKCYWFSWGSDIYKYQQDNLRLKLRLLYIIKKVVVKRMGHIVATVKGEYENIKNWFGAEGEWHTCFKYPSNLFKEESAEDLETGDELKLLLGNSADPSNHHEEALELIKKSSKGIKISKIYCPLSYGGDEKYVRQVISKGKALFGRDFIPLTEFIPREKYLNLLSAVDIAVFNHRRQQAMGNIITLLGYGKKVFIREEVTPWKFFAEIGVRVFPTNCLELSRMDEDDREQNKNIIKSYFSEQRLKNELEKIFES